MWSSARDQCGTLREFGLGTYTRVSLELLTDISLPPTKAGACPRANHVAIHPLGVAQATQDYNTSSDYRSNGLSFQRKFVQDRKVRANGYSILQN